MPQDSQYQENGEKRLEDLGVNSNVTENAGNAGNAGNAENIADADIPAKTSKKSIIVELYEWVDTFVMVPVIVILIFAFICRTNVVSGESMVNTLHPGEMLVISKLFYTPERGDIVVLVKPEYGMDKPIVKRIIATEGQSVDIDFDAGVVYVDGQPQEEPYTNTPTNLEYDVQFPITVQSGHVFVMGDNRNGSLDSRATIIGQVDERYLMGRAYFRMLPFGSAGSLLDK